MHVRLMEEENEFTIGLFDLVDVDVNTGYRHRPKPEGEEEQNPSSISMNAAKVIDWYVWCSQALLDGQSMHVI